MNSITAIAYLAMKAAVRSRLFVSMGIVLVGSLAGLPWIVKGDGTLAGYVSVLLNYGLGFAAIALGAATLWTACGSISLDIEHRHICMTCSKPVRPVQIWLGKWIGIALLNMLLLGAAGTTLYGGVMLRVYAGNAGLEERREAEREVLVGRRCVAADRTGLEEKIRERFNALNDDARTEFGVNEEAAFAGYRQRALAQRSTAWPDRPVRWIFRIPRPAAKNGQVTLRYRFMSILRDEDPVPGLWTILNPDGEELWRGETSDAPDGIHAVTIPGSAVAGANELACLYTNIRKDNPRGVMFEPNRDPELLISESGFAANYLRALIILGCHIGLLAALGLTAGSVFSFPIATFMACAILVAAAAANYLAFASAPGRSVRHHHHGPAHEMIPPAARRGMERAAGLLHKAVEPAMTLHPVGMISDGLLVSWRMTGRAIAVLTGMYSGAFLIAACLALRRRELALPAKT